MACSVAVSAARRREIWCRAELSGDDRKLCDHPELRIAPGSIAFYVHRRGVGYTRTVLDGTFTASAREGKW